MNVECLSYMNPLEYGGGGEMITRALINEGEARGHTININSVRPGIRTKSRDTDLFWLVDVFNFPQTLRSRGAWLQFSRSWLEHIADNAKFIHMNNAYVDVCNLGYLPCSGNAKTSCDHKSIANISRNIALRDFSKSCFAMDPLVKKIFMQSALNVYLSPLHQSVIEKILGSKGLAKSLIVKPTVDSNLFYNQNIERDIDYLFVGVIGEAKGLAEMREKYADKDIHFVGKVAPGERLDFGVYHGSLPYSEVAKIMNRAKNFVFLPRWPEPQGRVVIEAAMCGCNLITNDNVGATSFPFNIGDATNFIGAAGEFWDVVEKLGM
jgi:glycosyltransferase involved in cell wall biosynthesis